MTVLSVPTRLILATSALFLSVPMIAIEVMIVTQAPWWRPPYEEMITWALATFCLCVVSSIGLLSAKKGAFLFVLTLIAVWTGLSGLTALRLRCPPLGFFTLSQLVIFTGVLSWIKFELKQTFFDPQLTWYQGSPKPIPGLQCIVSTGDRNFELNVSRIDLVGAFIFSSSSPLAKPEIHSAFSTLLERKKLQMTFNFRDRQIICAGCPILSIDRAIGVGVQFQSISPDLRQDLGKFIELLHVEGYV